MTNNINYIDKTNRKTYTFSDIEIRSYEISLIEELRKLNASQSDINLISIEMIQNAILVKADPKDVAWALIQ